MKVLITIVLIEGCFLYYCSLMACAIIYIIMNSVLIINLFLGLPYHYSQANLIQVMLNFFGCVTMIWYILVEWSARSLWNIWIPFG